MAKVKTSLGFLQDMDDSQMETALLRSCLAFPKLFPPSELALPITSTMLWRNSTMAFESHWKPS